MYSMTTLCLCVCVSVSLCIAEIFPSRRNNVFGDENRSVLSMELECLSLSLACIFLGDGKMSIYFIDYMVGMSF